VCVSVLIGEYVIYRLFLSLCACFCVYAAMYQEVEVEEGVAYWRRFSLHREVMRLP
jgi:hypothetical protein